MLLSFYGGVTVISKWSIFLRTRSELPAMSSLLLNAVNCDARGVDSLQELCPRVASGFAPFSGIFKNCGYNRCMRYKVGLI
jgi:hypothetical protein